MAPAGGVTLALSPMRSMVPFLMMMVWLGRAGAPVPSMTLDVGQRHDRRIDLDVGANSIAELRLRRDERRRDRRKDKREEQSSIHRDLRYQVQLPEGGGQRPIS